MVRLRPSLKQNKVIVAAVPYQCEYIYRGYQGKSINTVDFSPPPPLSFFLWRLLIALVVNAG